MSDTIKALIISIISFTFALIALWYAWITKRKLLKIRPVKQISRHSQNPIMSPPPHSEWEAGGTFNPTAVMDTSGRVHLLYRAVGSDGISRIGYASSDNGFSIDDHSSYPVFSLKNPRENIPDKYKRRDPVMYPSGGSWGGCEDPRVVQIGDTIYMTFNAFNGWDFVRIGVVSIKAKDFFQKKWNWGKLLFISPKGQVNKNWVLFPEKINGKFAILHSVSPEPQIDFVDHLEDLDNGSRTIKSHFGQKKPRKEWDTWIRGAGPSPIKTEYGWLVLYHATNKDDPHKYKLGALLLDLNNPKKVLARSVAPLLTSETWYENDWKPGVVYACGAAVKNNILYVYYGGGDKHVCVAHTPLKELLEWMLKYGKV
jgi:beta-1,2-mannobiose phosphorylase / 1,2-beta-oligomannan phosphorylase